MKIIPKYNPTTIITAQTGAINGIKLYVGKKSKSIESDVGEGICMECGSKIIDARCPNCDLNQE